MCLEQVEIILRGVWCKWGMVQILVKFSWNDIVAFRGRRRILCVFCGGEVGFSWQSQGVVRLRCVTEVTFRDRRRESWEGEVWRRWYFVIGAVFYVYDPLRSVGCPPARTAQRVVATTSTQRSANRHVPGQRQVLIDAIQHGRKHKAQLNTKLNSTTISTSIYFQKFCKDASCLPLGAGTSQAFP